MTSENALETHVRPNTQLMKENKLYTGKIYLWQNAI